MSIEPGEDVFDVYMSTYLYAIETKDNFRSIALPSFISPVIFTIVEDSKPSSYSIVHSHRQPLRPEVRTYCSIKYRTVNDEGTMSTKKRQLEVITDPVKFLADFGFHQSCCSYCQKTVDELDGKLMQCGKCKKIYFCSIEVRRYDDDNNYA